ncbi:MAG: hypothetical protein K2N20_05695 [Helicobacter sp.]|nr:hypothetical protein [Helicobacter sp.]
MDTLDMRTIPQNALKYKLVAIAKNARKQGHFAYKAPILGDCRVFFNVSRNDNIFRLSPQHGQMGVRF